MSGVIYVPIELFNYGMSGIPVRPARLRDNSSGSRAGRTEFGVIRLGGTDYLFPSCEGERDICVYVDGHDDTTDASTPKLTIDAGGRTVVPTNLAACYKSDVTQFPPQPSGYYISRSLRRTYKYKGNYYGTYDPYMHRLAGQSGIDSYSNLCNTLYTSAVRGTLFYYDYSSGNKYAPTVVSLFALNNITLDGVLWRHWNTDPTSGGNIWWDSMDMRYQGNIGSGYADQRAKTFYVQDANTPVYTCVIRSLQTSISINNVSHTLFMAAVDPPIADYGNSWAYTESPWWHLTRTDTTKAASCYCLDECVTIHRQDV